MPDRDRISAELVWLARLMDHCDSLGAWFYVYREGTAMLREAGLSWQDVLRLPPEPASEAFKAEASRDAG